MAKGTPDLEPIFASAPHVFEHRFTTPRQHHGYIEPRSTVVWIDPDGLVHVHSPNKAPFKLKEHLSIVAEIPVDRIVIEPSYIGGDFGGKGLVIDEFACYFLAKATGRPVKAITRYTDELRGTVVRHRSEIRLRTAVDRDGVFLAFEAEVIYNGGAYAAPKINPMLLPGGLGFATAGYRVPHVQIDVLSMYTNTVPAGNMRSPVDVQTFFAMEVHVDTIARALGIDPLEFRLRNVMRPDTAITDQAVNATRGRGARGATARGRLEEAPAAGARARTTDGWLEVIYGTPDQGSGSATVVQRVLAAELGIARDRIGVRRHHTSNALVDPGAGASRVTHIVGNATISAARRLKARLEARSGMQLVDGDFVDAAGKRESFADVGGRVCAQGPLRISGDYNSEHEADHKSGDFSFSAFAIEVAVDRETGAIKVVDAVLVIDVATILNPIGHQGQIEGGFVYGIGGALQEELLYEDGKLTALSLGEYKLPTIMDLPPLRTVHVPGAPGNGPLGAKMAGELSNSGVAPAIANAVYDAAGVWLTTFPLTPERVYDAIQAHGASKEEVR
jgi:putative selenate reductase molybdopterin-binding subunit